MNGLLFALTNQILYWTDDSKESMIGRTRVSGNVTTKNITGLKANTIYFASVRAYNTAGTGPSSPPVNVTTKKSRKYPSPQGKLNGCVSRSPFLTQTPFLSSHLITLPLAS